ncbi:hypothetical protein H920_12462 [Fukomys damarensis]|uniref:Uncharacterized protein n=1 Tax=Fukomys damarensis TaxID=885580 RepID=A0A091D542_FUKDA|nr:hypothetical protein H920_12462 [Fukomys damarensis]
MERTHQGSACTWKAQRSVVEARKPTLGGGEDLCYQAEGSALEPGSDIHGEDQSSPDENTSHSQQQQGPKLLFLQEQSSSHQRNQLQQTSPKNQHPKIFPFYSLFMMLATVLK